MKYLAYPLSLLVVLGYFAHVNYLNERLAANMLHHDELTRPSFNDLCGKYYEWSMMMKDRVSQMEKQCSMTRPDFEKKDR